MSLHKGGFLPSAVPPAPRAAANQWTWNYPNSADFNFNYYNLLLNAQGAIGTLNPGLSVAVVGTGVAGLLAARELYRCGITKIDIYEATDRIGGRNYSIPAPTPSGGNQQTTYEMGAMRMPFFPDPGLGGCVLDYLCTEFSIAMTPFPDPGSNAVASTGIYVNGGYGPSGTYSKPTLDIWLKGQAPPNPIYANIATAWTNFQALFQKIAGPLYGTSQWAPFWQDVVQNYWMTNFRELALMPAITQYNQQQPGFFGGLGLTEEQATILYVIGVGDGGWGAFYDISCLYVFRTILCNFGNDHQLIRGRYVNGQYAPGPQYNSVTTDTQGVPFASPNYLGLQSVAECLFFMSVNGPGGPMMSLYDAIQPASPLPTAFFSQTPVTGIAYSGTGATVYSSKFPAGKGYSAVVLTPTTWAVEMSPSPTASPAQTFFQSFTFGQMPIEVTTAIKESHQITSSKVFWPLKQQFWGGSSPIPQVINTDSFIQDVYGIAASPTDPGVLLVSYTWEDDAVKLESDDDATLAQRCLNELDRILTQTLGTTISQYVNVAAGPVVIHWEQQPTYRGCAKLYREGSYDMDFSLLSWNQNLAANSNFYFAGESYSVEGGWTEPALRMALDAVINIINNAAGTFTVNGFTYSAYPQWQNWSPSEQTRLERAIAAGARGGGTYHTPPVGVETR